MKEIKDKNYVNDKTCQARECGCSVNHILLGLAAVFIILFAAVIFGN